MTLKSYCTCILFAVSGPDTDKSAHTARSPTNNDGIIPETHLNIR